MEQHLTKRLHKLTDLRVDGLDGLDIVSQPEANGKTTKNKSRRENMVIHFIDIYRLGLI